MDSADRRSWRDLRRSGLWRGLMLAYFIGMDLLAGGVLTVLTLDWSGRLAWPEPEPRPEYLAMAAFMAGVIFLASLLLGWLLLERLRCGWEGRRAAAAAAVGDSGGSAAATVGEQDDAV